MFLIHAHLVFVTKYRRGVFTKEILNDLRMVFASVCADFESELVEFDGESFRRPIMVLHMELLQAFRFELMPTGEQTRKIRQKNYPSIRRKLWGGALWSPSYFAGSCDGAPIEVVRQYIEQQRAPR